MTDHEICEANRKGWNETAAIHERTSLDGLLKAVQSSEFCTFDDVERRVFDRIDLAGKSVVQIACNNARELIAIKRAGAGDCVGFDISDDFIDQARRLIAASELEVQVVRSNVYDISAEYHGLFGLAYITVGALGWLPSLPRLFSKVADLLKPGGQIFIYEMHPFLFVYDEETADPRDPRISRSYFRETPVVFADSQDYLDPQSIVHSPGYWHQHTLGKIMSSLLGAGLALESFEEFAHDISMNYAEFARHAGNLPMCYALVARKPSD